MIKREIKLYSVNELNEQALEKAYEKWYYDNYEYTWHDENEDTLNKFCEVFNINVRNFQYDSYNYNYRFEVENENIEDLSYIRLLAHLNNYFDDIYKGKYYSKSFRIGDKYNYIHRHSKVMFEKNDCSLTGYYLDNEILQPVFEFIKKPRNITFKELMNECLENFFEACSEDVKNLSSEEYFKEQSSDNDWVYLNDGTIFLH